MLYTISSRFKVYNNLNIQQLYMRLLIEKKKKYSRSIAFQLQNNLFTPRLIHSASLCFTLSIASCTLLYLPYAGAFSHQGCRRGEESYGAFGVFMRVGEGEMQLARPEDFPLYFLLFPYIYCYTQRARILFCCKRERELSCCRKLLLLLFRARIVREGILLIRGG